jgi:hypothetical protein
MQTSEEEKQRDEEERQRRSAADPGTKPGEHSRQDHKSGEGFIAPKDPPAREK